MELAETLNRTVKLAMDEGRVASYEEAQALFASFRLRIRVEKGFTSCPAAEAAVLTLLKAAPKTILGGVELEGAREEQCTLAWYAGMPLAQVCQLMGVETTSVAADFDIPILQVGGGSPCEGAFSIGISFLEDGFMLSPDVATVTEVGAPIEAGAAAAGAALNEVFAHAYRRNPLAGQREVRFRLPDRGHRVNVHDAWMVGLGHLGQACLWTVALAYRGEPRRIKLTDFDNVSWSSLSTCLLVDARDVGLSKADAVGRKLAALGIEAEVDVARLQPDRSPVHTSQHVVVVAVDNLALRRTLDHVHGARVLEGGIGDGVDGFTRVQFHEFPGPRKARDVWAEGDAGASRRTDISPPAYQALLRETGDECGTTLVAGRSVATPFVGSVAGAILAWLGGGTTMVNHSLCYDVNAL